MTQSIDNIGHEQRQQETLARKRSTSHTSILNAIRNPLCNGWGGETDAIPPERGRSTERLLLKRNDRRSLSLDSSCMASKDVSSTEVDSDESSSSVEPKSNDDDSSMTVYDDCCSIRSGTDSELTDAADGDYGSSGRTNVQSSICRFDGNRKVIIGNNPAQNILGLTAKLNWDNTRSVASATGDRDAVRRREAMRVDKRESPGLNSNKLINGLGTSHLKNKVEHHGANDSKSLNFINSKLPPIHHNFGKKEEVSDSLGEGGAMTLNGSGLQRSTECGMVNEVLVDTTNVRVSWAEQSTDVTRTMPTIFVEHSPCDEEHDTVSQLNEDDESLHADWPQNYVFQLARAFSYRAKKVSNNSVSSSRRPKLDPSVFQQHQSPAICESEKTSSSAAAKTPVIEEHPMDTESKLINEPPSEWSDRSRSSSFDDDWRLIAVGKRNVRDTVRLFNMQATSRSFDRLNLNLRSPAEPASVEMHAVECDGEDLTNSRRVTGRSVSVGRPTRAPGMLVQERMKVFECRRD